MKRIIPVFATCLLFISCNQSNSPAKQSSSSNIPIPERKVVNNVIISPVLPEIEIKVDPEFEYVGKFDFEIIASSNEYEDDIKGKAIAGGERVVFVNADASKAVKKLFIVQFEGFLPEFDYTYNYNFDNAEYIGKIKYRPNTWFYNSKELAIQNPNNEGAKTRNFLQDKGYSLEDEYMMSRFVGLASEDRVHEIIIYYIEMLGSTTGYSLDVYENEVAQEEKEKIRLDLVDRSKKSFSIIKG